MPGAAGGGGPLDSPAHATSAAASAGVSLLPAVVASHEADGAGEMVGTRRRLGGARGDPFDRLAWLRRRAGAGLRFWGGGWAPRLRCPRPPADRARLIGDAVGQLGDALAGPGRAGRRRGDAAQVLEPDGRALRHFRQVAADALEQRGRAVQGAARVLGRFAHVARLAPALLGEFVNLVGHDREAAAVHARARRLDRGVQGQQVGLIRDEADGLRELLDLLGDVAQPVYLARALLGGGAEVGEAAHGSLSRLADLFRRLLHLGPGGARLVTRGGDLPGVLFELAGLPLQRPHEARGPGGAPAGPPPPAGGRPPRQPP